MRRAAGLPPMAAWRHETARDGFEVAHVVVDEHGGLRVRGTSVAVEGGAGYAVRYELVLDDRWRTRRADVRSEGADGVRARLLEGDGDGRWRVDGAACPELDGCLDVDLEASALTNAFPVHRLRLREGEAAEAPAAYVRAFDASAGRLEQRYERLAHDGAGERYAYAAPAFAFTAELVYDAAGLVVTYPGLPTRVA